MVGIIAPSGRVVIIPRAAGIVTIGDATGKARGGSHGEDEDNKSFHKVRELG
jgi:hypothetical protein